MISLFFRYGFDIFNDNGNEIWHFQKLSNVAVSTNNLAVDIITAVLWVFRDCITVLTGTR